MSDNCDYKNEFVSRKVEKITLKSTTIFVGENINFKASFAYMNEEKGKKIFK